MKIAGKPTIYPTISPKTPPLSHSDLPSKHKLHPTKPSSFPSSSARFKKTRPTFGKRSRPQTPALHKCRIEARDRRSHLFIEEENDRGGCGKVKKGIEVPEVSARKLAAGLWRLQFPETVGGDGGGGVNGGLQHTTDRLGFQSSVSHVQAPVLCHRNGKSYWSDSRGVLQNPAPVSDTKNGFLCENIISVMERSTKWDPVCLKTSDEIHQIQSHTKLLDQKASSASLVSSLEDELEKARSRIQELETDHRSSKKKLEHFLKKVSEQQAVWRSKEHEKIRAFIEDIKADLKREKKNRQRMEFVNSKLVNEVADAKLLAKRYMQDYEKERKARELIEEVCDELAKEIGEDKAEVETLKRESMKLREEVDDERKILQMAEVWREERVQMKLVDAKVALEERYSHMNKLVADLEAFLKERTATPDVKEMREVELLQKAVASVNIHEIKEFSYEPPNPDDIFSVFEDVNFGEANEKGIEPCTVYSPASHASKIRTVSPEINADGIQRQTKEFINQHGDAEEDESGWETVSHLDDQRSSYSVEGSAASVNKLRRHSSFSGSETEWEEYGGQQTPITEISEVCSLPKKQLKKVSSIAKLWRSCPSNGENYKIISLEGTNGSRLSNVSVLSPERGSGKGGMSPLDMVGQWSSPDSGNSQITQGMKGCIEWPRASQKHSLKAKLIEARMESQKIQLRHVLKHKI